MLKSLEKSKREHTYARSVISKVDPSRNTNQHRGKQKKLSLVTLHQKEKFKDGKINHLRLFEQQFFHRHRAVKTFPKDK